MENYTKMKDSLESKALGHHAHKEHEHKHREHHDMGGTVGDTSNVMIPQMPMPNSNANMASPLKKGGSCHKPHRKHRAIGGVGKERKGQYYS